MAAYAAVTERIGIGSGVVNTWTRNVGLLAATFSTLDDLAPGRVKLGLGAWWEPLASKVGVHRHHPLQAMRETVEATRRLLAMERVTYHGEFVHLDDVEIDIVHGDRSPKHVPIYVGATGMKMMELAGEIGDGVLLNYLVGPGYNRQAMEALAEGAARAGRTVDDLDRPQLVVCSLDDDRSLALDRARELVAQYLGQQPHIMKASGVDESLLEEIGRVLTWPATPEQIERAMALVPDEVVQLITASGTPDECRAKVEEYVETRLHVPGPLSARRRRRRDDRRLRRPVAEGHELIRKEGRDGNEGRNRPGVARRPGLHRDDRLDGAGDRGGARRLRRAEGGAARPGRPHRLLPDKTLFMLFLDKSTRTRNAFETGMTQLGGHAIFLDADKTQVAHGESPKDMGIILSRLRRTASRSATTSRPTRATSGCGRSRAGPTSR